MWTIADTVVTTTIITPDRLSRRSDHCTSTPPAAIQVTIGTIWGASWRRMSKNTSQPSTAETTRAPQVTSCAAVADRAAEEPGDRRGEQRQEDDEERQASTLHHVNVLDLDGAAVAEIDDEDGKPDRRLGRGHGQHEHGEDLAGEVLQDDREGYEVDVDREQHQLDRHHDDDDVLAVEEDAENAEREQDRRDGQEMGEADMHPAHSPGAATPPPRTGLPTGTLTTSTDWARVRASCSAIDWRLTSARRRKVSTMAPIIATNRMTPAASKAKM